MNEIKAARELRQKKLAQADILLNKLDNYILSQLDLPLLSENSHNFFAVKLQKIKSSRYDPHFHNPTFRKLIDSIQRMTNAPLHQLAEFSNEFWKPELTQNQTFCYIEISGINTKTGEVTPTETSVSGAPSRARMVTRSGDILVSLTRPHRGAIAIIGDELDQCIASTGFAVIRTIRDKRINREYLWSVLRCSVCLKQMLQRSSGGNYPAITEFELGQISIPIPASSVQEKIVAETIQSHKQARQLREIAAVDWELAKARFEQKLLGEDV